MIFAFARLQSRAYGATVTRKTSDRSRRTNSTYARPSGSNHCPASAVEASSPSTPNDHIAPDLSRSGASSAASLAMVGSLRNLGRLTGPLVTGGTDFEALRAILKGSVILPTDGPYERGRRGELQSTHRCETRGNRALCRGVGRRQMHAFAREHSVEIAVRGGGHDILGASSCDGGLVIDSRR